MTRDTRRAAIFYVGLGALLTHEMDAMTHREWRILPGLSALGDSLGRDLFVLAHWPLYALVIGLIASLHRGLRDRARFWVSVFLVVHAGLHTAFSAQAAYTFRGPLSLSLIYGAAAFGIVYLFMARGRG